MEDPAAEAAEPSAQIVDGKIGAHARSLLPVGGATSAPSVFVLSTPRPDSGTIAIHCGPEVFRQWWKAGIEYERTVIRIADEIRKAERAVERARVWIPFERRRAARALENLRSRCGKELMEAEAAYAPVRKEIAGRLSLERWMRQRRVIDEEIWGWTKAAREDGTVVVHLFRHDVPPSDLDQAATAGRPRLSLPQLREVMIELGRTNARWDKAALAATERALAGTGFAALWHKEFREDFFTGHSYATGPVTGRGNSSSGSSTGGTGGYTGGGFFF
ncbi:keratin [Streptomyces albus subsp. chlorinus]|uniref:hypothetical protein n=1 Tax=Streptomyces albus TaxID=1888 RepID=UPI001D640220|nr:keratin [Streptomyces albus subsp. chlorinus]